MRFDACCANVLATVGGVAGKWVRPGGFGRGTQKYLGVPPVSDEGGVVFLSHSIKYR